MPFAHVARPLRALAGAALLAAITGGTGGIAASGPSRQAPVVDLTPDGVALAVSKYVAEYQKTFAFIVATETSLQRLEENGTPAGSRQLAGEIYWLYLAADDEWISVHDVITVDGRPAVDREDLRVVLQTGERGAIERIANLNARYNIGTIIRNFNEPTLPLLLFFEKRLKNLRLRRAGMRNDGEATIVTLAFEERDRPTLISSATGGPVFAKGSFVVEAGTGRVRETTLELVDGPVTATLATTYAADEHVGLWVPTNFRERYERRHRDGKREVVIVDSKYSNYQKFMGTGRIKGGGQAPTPPSSTARPLSESRR